MIIIMIIILRDKSNGIFIIINYLMLKRRPTWPRWRCDSASGPAPGAPRWMR